MSYDQERRARALETYKKMGWGENEIVKEIDMELWKMITDVMFGEIWSRPGLSLRDRELITLGVLVADRAEGMKLHMRTRSPSRHHLRRDPRDHLPGDVLRRPVEGTVRDAPPEGGHAGVGR